MVSARDGCQGQAAGLPVQLRDGAAVVNAMRTLLLRQRVHADNVAEHHQQPQAAAAALKPFLPSHPSSPATIPSPAASARLLPRQSRTLLHRHPQDSSSPAHPLLSLFNLLLPAAIPLRHYLLLLFHVHLPPPPPLLSRTLYRHGSGTSLSKSLARAFPRPLWGAAAARSQAT